MTTPPTCPLPRSKVVDQYFVEHRAKLLDIAAFLDRVERAEPDGATVGDDYRLTAFRDAVRVLLDNNPHRAKRILELLSDPTKDPIETPDGQGAAGAWKARG